ncbi:hypothetical protein GC167_09015 [bacterium]|nr:hypothetical protein [bacterium]
MKSTYTTALIIGLFLLASARVGAQKVTEGVYLPEAIASAQEYRSEGKYLEALELLEHTGTWDSLFGAALVERVLNLLELKRYSDALDEAREKHRLEPQSPNSYELLAVVHSRSERLDSALGSVEKGLRKFPYNQHLQLKKAIYLD